MLHLNYISNLKIITLISLNNLHNSVDNFFASKALNTLLGEGSNIYKHIFYEGLFMHERTFLHYGSFLYESEKTYIKYEKKITTNISKF